jgi:hypothetical protein
VRAGEDRDPARVRVGARWRYAYGTCTGRTRHNCRGCSRLTEAASATIHKYTSLSDLVSSGRGLSLKAAYPLRRAAYPQPCPKPSCRYGNATRCSSVLLAVSCVLWMWLVQLQGGVSARACLCAYGYTQTRVVCHRARSTEKKSHRVERAMGRTGVCVCVCVRACVCGNLA